MILTCTYTKNPKKYSQMLIIRNLFYMQLNAEAFLWTPNGQANANKSNELINLMTVASAMVCNGTGNAGRGQILRALCTIKNLDE